MSELDNFLKYVLSLAEHGRLEYVTVNKELSASEIEDLFSSYPFKLDDNFTLICSPHSEPTTCRLFSPGMGFVCEKPLYSTRVVCYNNVTGELYSSETSEKIFSVLSKASKMCGLRFILHVKNKFTPPKINAVPPQDNPVPPKEIEEKEVQDDVQKLFGIVEELKRKYGTPPTTPPPTPPTPPPVKVEKKYETCLKLANDFGFYEMKDAIKSGDKQKMENAYESLARIMLNSDRALVDYKKYSALLRKCHGEIES